jgi:hypothetical protein
VGYVKWAIVEKQELPVISVPTGGLCLVLSCVEH